MDGEYISTAIVLRTWKGQDDNEGKRED